MLEKGKCYDKLPKEYLMQVLNFEGLKSMNKNDCGNWFNGQLKGTIRGITYGAYNRARIDQVIPYSIQFDDLLNDLESVRKIYEKNYYLRFKCNKIPHPLSFAFFDCCINCGGGGASRILQKEINGFLTDTKNHVKIDNAIGDKTLKGLQMVIDKGIDIRIICDVFNNMRSNYYDAIVANKPNQRDFLSGWKNRLAKVENYCKC